MQPRRLLQVVHPHRAAVVWRTFLLCVGSLSQIRDDLDNLV